MEREAHFKSVLSLKPEVYRPGEMPKVVKIAVSFIRRIDDEINSLGEFGDLVAKYRRR